MYNKCNWTVASVSYGKDSLAMVLYILDHGLPLDEVIFYDTGMEFDAIYRNRDRLTKILAQRGIRYTELKPANPMLWDMTERPVTSKQNGNHSGYGWCGGVCRWGTTRKTQAMDRATKGAYAHYIGIAADEPKRIERLAPPKIALLAQIGMTEADALQYCYDRGWSWDEPTPRTASGYIDLYQILDRVSCWCCCNKNRKELRNIYYYLPDYWARLEALQDKIDRPMKRFSNRKYGEYGNVHRMADVFKEETKNVINL